MSEVSVLVADAQPVFRAAVRTLLERAGGFRVAEVSDLAGVEASFADGTVCIALIDLDLPPRGALDAVFAIAASGHGRTQAVVWGYGAPRDVVSAAVSAGAVGFLDKSISSQGLLHALRSLAPGAGPLPNSSAFAAINGLHAFEHMQGACERSAALSSREREVLGHIVSGARNKQIAAYLDISEFTVKRHVQNILRKLELRTRREAGELYRAAFAGEREAARL